LKIKNKTGLDALKNRRIRYPDGETNHDSSVIQPVVTTLTELSHLW